MNVILEEIIHDLNGATVFSKIDLNAGYHQIELHPDSRYITTFSTHTGLKRYKSGTLGYVLPQRCSSKRNVWKKHQNVFTLNYVVAYLNKVNVQRNNI